MRRRALLIALGSLILVPGAVHIARAANPSGHDGNKTSGGGGGGGNPDNHDGPPVEGGGSTGDNPTNHDPNRQTVLPNG